MASFFGEVIESSSRAYDGNCEDTSLPIDPVDSISSYELSWKVDDDSAEKALFIILDGRCALGISEALRCHSSLIAEISEASRKGDGDHRLKASESSSLIYRLSNGVYVCEVSPDVKLVNANYFSFKLLQFLKKSKEVMIVTWRSSHGYFSSCHNSVTFIRGLCNSTFSSNGCKLLTPCIDNCNIVTGVPASVFLWCSLMKINASVYACYTPKEEMDSTLWKLFVSLLSNYELMKDLLSKINFKERETVNRTGNLYL